MSPRKPSPAHLTHAEVEAMIAEAVAAERTRSERAMAGVMLALGGAGQAMDILAGAVAEAGATLDLHAIMLEQIADAFAAGLGLTGEDQPPADTIPADTTAN